MRMKPYQLYTVTVALTLASCSPPDPNQHIEEGQLVESTYTSEEIGWTMQVPDGWTILSTKEVTGYEDTGKELLSETLGEEIEADELKNLLHFKKDRFNLFQSTSEPFVVEYEGEWSENNRALKKVILEAYENQGIPTESSEIRREEIDGIEFEVFEIFLIDSEGKTAITQTMYSSLINGYDFGANMTYNSDENRDVMLAAWRNSNFREIPDEKE